MGTLTIINILISHSCMIFSEFLFGLKSYILIWGYRMAVFLYQKKCCF